MRDPEGEAMTIQVRPVAQSGTCSMLVFGDAGGGKTTYIGSGGKDYSILLIRSPEDHVDCILGSGVNEIVVRDWEEMNEVQSMLHHEGGKYDWVWLEFALWQERGLRDVYGVALDRAGAPGTPARDHRKQFGPDKGEFRINMDRITELVADLSSSEAFHFGMTAHSWVGPTIFTEDDIRDDLPSEQVQPWVQGKNMIPKISGMFNVVGYLYVTQAKIRGQQREVRKIQFDKTPNMYVKNQIKKPDGTSIIPEGYMINPTLPKFMEAYNTRQRSAGRARPVRGRRSGRTQ
jgi:hypothetical protein